MAGEEGEAEGEVGAGEDGEGLDEDVGHGLIAGEMGVELVAAMPMSAYHSCIELCAVRCSQWCCFQIELIIQLQWAE